MTNPNQIGLISSKKNKSTVYKKYVILLKNFLSDGQLQKRSGQMQVR